MKKFLLLLFLIYSCFEFIFAQTNNTDISLFLRSDSIQVNFIESKSGDLFNELGHHGPAIENEYFGLRVYFSQLASIDLYSKKTRGLELKKFKWYPTSKQQEAGAGGDYYKVGKTIGLGSIRLWDGEKVQLLSPVDRRSCRVVKEANHSFLEMLSEGVPYKGEKVDILVRVTVFSGIREAKVEAFALCDQKVQFVTGINYFDGMQVKSGTNYVATWGIHPEDINVGKKMVLGSAIIFNTKDYLKIMDEPNEKIYISAPTKYISLGITATNDTGSDLNNVKNFMRYVNELSLKSIIW
jgi:hypothetical protein